MKTIVDRIDFSAGSFEGNVEFFFELMEQAGVKVFLCNSRLVGHDDDRHSHVVQQPNGLWNTTENIELRKSERGVHDPRILVIYQGIDDSVTIKKNSARSGHSLIRRGSAISLQKFLSASSGEKRRPEVGALLALHVG